MEDNKTLWALDMLSERAKEFIHIYDAVMQGEQALQTKDEKEPTEWQAISIISAFINYVAERSRVRYGHFAFDIEAKNNESKQKDALAVLARMEIFWERLGEDKQDKDITAEQLEERGTLFQRFIENDRLIREHLSTQPDVYAEGIDQSQHREWMMRLRLLGETERHLVGEWRELIAGQRVKLADKE